MATSSLMLKRPTRKSLIGRDHDGIAQNDRANESAGAGQRGAGFKQPVHDIGVEDKNHAQDRLPEMHDRMRMVVAAAA